MKQPPYPGLELDTDYQQERREWRIQRIAWVLLTLLLLAVMAGLLGRGGPLSARHAATPDRKLTLQYDRFVRHHSPDRLHVRAAATGDTVRVRLDAGWLRDVALREVTPQPERVEAGHGAQVFVFNTRPGGELEAAFHFEPESPGALHGWIAADDGPALRFEQFVHP